MPTPAEVAVDRFDCPQCKRPAKAKCVSGTGTVVPPHARRFGRGEGWLAAQVVAPAPPVPQPRTNRPTQPAAIVYGDPAKLDPTIWGKRGALIVAGRDNYAALQFKAVSAAGATVLLYVDAPMLNPTGRYHAMLFNGVTRWPGVPQDMNGYGGLADFRPGSRLHQNLEAVLEQAVAENPHLGGFYADDLGTRSWFPGLNWDTFADKQAYRDGAIALAATFRKVADRHGLLFVVNGTWTAGSLANSGGGYNSTAADGGMGKHGCNLADGAVIEDHPITEALYWRDYSRGQWKNPPIVIAQVRDATARDAWVRADIASHVSQQPDYESVPAAWGAFADVGMPSRVTA